MNIHEKKTSLNTLKSAWNVKKIKSVKSEKIFDIEIKPQLYSDSSLMHLGMKHTMYGD